MANINNLFTKVVEKYEVFGSDIVVYNPQHKNNKEIENTYIKYMEGLKGDNLEGDNKYLVMANLLKILTNIEGIEDVESVAKLLKSAEEENEMSQDLVETFDYIFDILYDTTNTKARMVEKATKVAKVDLINANNKKNLDAITSSQGLALNKKNRNNKTVILDEIKKNETERNAEENKSETIKEVEKQTSKSLDEMNIMELKAELERLELKKKISELKGIVEE